jgi:hypothetical protein
LYRKEDDSERSNILFPQKYLINIALQSLTDLDRDLQTRDPLSGFISAYGMSVAAGKLGKIFLTETGIYSFLFEIGSDHVYLRALNHCLCSFCLIVKHGMGKLMDT